MLQIVLVSQLQAKTESFIIGLFNRWDVKAVEELPEYMRVMFSAISEFTNELARETSKDHGLDVLPYIQEQVTSKAMEIKIKDSW